MKKLVLEMMAICAGALIVSCGRHFPTEKQWQEFLYS